MCKTNLTPNKPTTLAQLNFGTQSLSVATYLNVYDQPHSHVCSDQTKDQLKSVSFNAFNNKHQCLDIQATVHDTDVHALIILSNTSLLALKPHIKIMSHTPMASKPRVEY